MDEEYRIVWRSVMIELMMDSKVSDIFHMEYWHKKCVRNWNLIFFIEIYGLSKRSAKGW